MDTTSSSVPKAFSYEPAEAVLLNRRIGISNPNLAVESGAGVRRITIPSYSTRVGQIASLELLEPEVREKYGSLINRDHRVVGQGYTPAEVSQLQGLASDIDLALRSRSERHGNFLWSVLHRSDEALSSEPIPLGGIGWWPLPESK